MVTVSGSGFTGATAAMFGTAAGTNLTVLNDTRLTVTSPAHAAGAVDVLVVVSGTTSATGAADLFTFLTPPPSNPPSRFVGSVTINGQPAPSGTVVEVRIGSVTCGATTTFLSGGQSRYVLDSPPQDAAHPGCGSDGTAVAFFVGGAKADQAGTWRSYDLNTVDLTLTTAPAPAPTPTPTSPAPLPPSAGTGSALGAGAGSPAVWIALMVIGAATLLAGSVVAGGSRRAAVVPVSMPAAEVVPAPMSAPVPSRSIAYAERGHRTSQGWWAAAAVGAAAVAVTLLVARNRR
jgi:hypothetical protein